LGVLYLLVENGVQLKGRRAVVVGRSNIVGKPMALLLLQMNATVSVCHSKTQDLADYTRNADIIVTAIGKPGFIQKDHVKEGAAVVDVGQNRLPTGVLCGDTDIPHLMGHAGYLTPIPGGVGPMTVALLMWNTLLAFLLQEDHGAVHLPRLGALHEDLFGHLEPLALLNPSDGKDR
jgi:methylenetetrahydrofolate dehydrogenase (NADP+)/methenyltetrahydrofolate cyclohydrolase